MTKHYDTQVSDPKLSALYRSLEESNPDPYLDKKILDAAHFAVKNQESKKSWVLPVSLAATLVLSVSLTMEYLNPDPDSVETSPRYEIPMENQKSMHRPEEHALRSEMPRPPPVSAPEIGDTLHTPDSPRLASDIPLLDKSLEGTGLPDVSGSDPYHDFVAEDWLTQVQALWKNGDHAHARGAFAEFRQRFPDHPLPADFPVSESSLLIEP